MGWNDCYAATKADGLVWAGSTEEDVGFDEQLTTKGRDVILEGLVRLLPVAQEARVVQQTACLRPMSSDGLPMLGRLPGRANVYIATGTGRQGVLLGPGMGRSLAQIITTGSSTFSVSPFAVDRFTESGGTPWTQ